MADAVTVKDFEPLLDKLLTDTQVEAHRMSRVANRNRLFDIMFRGISVVLAVAAPALVTYSSVVTSLQPKVSVDGAGVSLHLGIELYKIGIILIVALAGASVTLTSVFSFGRKYANAAIAYARLTALQQKIEFEKLFFFGADAHEIYSRNKQVLINLTNEKLQIIFDYMQGDIQVIAGAEAMGK